MKLSIVTPTFNSEKTVRRTVESILSQSKRPDEIIIVDNVSSDNTLKVVQELVDNSDINLKIISEKDKGISDAFSKGVAAATGDIVGILNSDDEYYDNNALSRIYEAFVNRDADFVHGNMLFIDEEHGSNIRRPLMCSLEEAFPYNHPSFFLLKKVYDEIGLFNLNYRFVMDFDLICRMYSTPTECKYNGVYVDGEPIVRMYAGGVSWTHELDSLKELEKALKSYGFYTSKAKKHLMLRKIRIKMKNTFSKMGLNFLVKLWRKYKWSN